MVVPLVFSWWIKYSSLRLCDFLCLWRLIRVLSHPLQNTWSGHHAECYFFAETFLVVTNMLNFHISDTDRCDTWKSFRSYGHAFKYGHGWFASESFLVIGHSCTFQPKSMISINLWFMQIPSEQLWPGRAC
jgi:hypothetical protein